MKTLVNWNPTADFRAMDEMFDRLFGAPVRPATGNVAASLPVDITEREGKLFVRAAVPGVDPKDLDVQVENNVLTIRGETRSEGSHQDEKVYRREVQYGAFARSIRLPEGLDLNSIDAEFRNGVVTITLPRLIEEKPKALKVAIRNAEPIAADVVQDATTPEA